MGNCLITRAEEPRIGIEAVATYEGSGKGSNGQNYNYSITFEHKRLFTYCGLRGASSANGNVSYGVNKDTLSYLSDIEGSNFSSFRAPQNVVITDYSISIGRAAGGVANSNGCTYYGANFYLK